MGYTPILNTMLQSSILLEDVSTRWLWTVLLILADQSRDTKGIVDCPIERLAQIANLPIEETRAAIDRLCAPDPKSRSKVGKGRRLVPVVVGRDPESFEVRTWRLVNWGLYKKRLRKMQVAAAVRRHRSNHPVITGNQVKSNRNPPSPSPALIERIEQKEPTTQPANHLIQGRRPELESEAYRIVREIATLEPELDPTDILLEAARWEDREGRSRSKVRVETMSDDHLIRTVHDLRSLLAGAKEAEKQKAIVEARKESASRALQAKA